MWLCQMRSQLRVDWYDSTAVWFSLTKTKMVKNDKITNSLTKTKSKKWIKMKITLLHCCLIHLWSFRVISHHAVYMSTECSITVCYSMFDFQFLMSRLSASLDCELFYFLLHRFTVRIRDCQRQLKCTEMSTFFYVSSHVMLTTSINQSVRMH